MPFWRRPKTPHFPDLSEMIASSPDPEFSRAMFASLEETYDMPTLYELCAKYLAFPAWAIDIRDEVEWHRIADGLS